MMQTLARDFMSEEYTDKVLKAMAKDEKGYAPETWKKMGDMNLMGLSIPEQYGGVGDFLDLTIVLEEMGRACFLGPYFSTVVLGASAIMLAGSEEQRQQYLPEIARGNKIITLALTEAGAKYTPESIQVKAVPQGSDFIINGVKIFVPDAQSADYIICVARTGEAKDSRQGISLFIVDINTPGITVKPLQTVTGDKQCEVTFDNVRVPGDNVLGQADQGWQYVDKILQRANAGRCAEMVGMAQQALKISLDYAKERIAFGHPIGAFQAIQHRCADMLMDVESSKFATYQAAWKLNEGLDATKDVALTKAWVSEACQRVMDSAHQIHGAIGFTEDHILHYYTKRTRAYEFSFGGADFQLEKLAELYH